MAQSPKKRPVARRAPAETAPTAPWLRRNVELSSLLFLALVVVVSWAFAELADEVVAGATHDLDRDVLLLLRAPGDIATPLGPPWLHELTRDVTALGGVAVLTLATVATSGFFLMRRKYGSMMYLLATVGGGILVSSIAKGFFDRPRPDLVPHDSIVRTASIPSSHSMMAAVAYLTRGVLIARVLVDRRLKVYVLSLAITILVGLSRIYLGVHWPTDVLARWLAGTGWAVACLVGARLVSGRGRVELEADE